MASSQHPTIPFTQGLWRPRPPTPRSHGVARCHLGGFIDSHPHHQHWAEHHLRHRRRDLCHCGRQRRHSHLSPGHSLQTAQPGVHARPSRAEAAAASGAAGPAGPLSCASPASCLHLHVLTSWCIWCKKGGASISQAPGMWNWTICQEGVGGTCWGRPGGRCLGLMLVCRAFERPASMLLALASLIGTSRPPTAGLGCLLSGPALRARPARSSSETDHLAVGVALGEERIGRRLRWGLDIAAAVAGQEVQPPLFPG